MVKTIIISLIIICCYFSNAKTSNAEQVETENENFKIGDRVDCTIFYESLEEDSANESMRIITKIQGILKKIIGTEFHIQVEGVSVRHYKNKWFVWLPDNSSLKPPPAKAGDTFTCEPQPEKSQKRSDSTVRSYIAIEKLSSY